MSPRLGRAVGAGIVAAVALTITVFFLIGLAEVIVWAQTDCWFWSCQ